MLAAARHLRPGRRTGPTTSAREGPVAGHTSIVGTRSPVFDGRRDSEDRDVANLGRLAALELLALQQPVDQRPQRQQQFLDGVGQPLVELIGDELAQLASESQEPLQILQSGRLGRGAGFARRGWNPAGGGLGRVRQLAAIEARTSRRSFSSRAEVGVNDASALGSAIVRR